MATFLDLPREVRWMIYRMILPPEFLLSRRERGCGSFSEGVPKYDPPNATQIIHVSRQIRQEALPLMKSRVRYMIHLVSKDCGRTLDLTFNWLQRFGPPNTDSLRKVTISHYHSSPPHLRDIFIAMSRLPRVSLQFNTFLWYLLHADSDKHLALTNVHGFARVSFVNWDSGFKFCDRHSQQPPESRQIWGDVDQRFKHAVANLTSPCRGKSCQDHRRHSPHHATSSLEIGWYTNGTCDNINCVSGVLEEEPNSWPHGRYSIFTLDKTVTKAAKRPRHSR